MLQSAERTDFVPASRIRGPRRVLKRLRLVLIATHRARKARAVTVEEIAWCDRAIDALVRVIDEGEAALPWYEDRREKRTVKKRP